MNKYISIFFLSFLTVVISYSCTSKSKNETSIFEALDDTYTGLHFNNALSYSTDFNLFKYMYFYNGSGIGAGDFNNDGLIDLFFGSNQAQNKLYLNKGSLQFSDATQQAEIPQDGGWSTGISVVDINNDGLLDMYVCRVGQYETLHSRNQMLINTGIDKTGMPHFKDKAKEYGLDFSGFSTQSAFFDYDNDGDLDMFLLNHSVHQNNNFRPRAVFMGTYDTLSGDRIFRNDNLFFTDVTRSTGINSTAISYGLGVVVADINIDGYPDLYIGNDFHENDYLYINQRNGTFKDESNQRFMHTSQYSMGVDVADINNDAYPEIISMDMLPSDPYILKRSLGEDTYDLFHEKIGMGYFYQFTRNNLQYNRRNGMFSETGLYSGIAATDWSWAPLWIDFNNDGLKDLFISNGIPKRMNDIDYVNFVTDTEVQQKISNDAFKGKDMSLIQKFPEIKIPNKFYLNKGNLIFNDAEKQIDNNLPTFSNGAVYADFDNDGDLDIVVNNIDNNALLYKNKSNDDSTNQFIELNLRGPKKNRNAIGANVCLMSKSDFFAYENYPVRGFLSSMQMPLHIGLGKHTIDSAIIIWPDRTCQTLSIKTKSKNLTVEYTEGLPLFDFAHAPWLLKNSTVAVEDITSLTAFSYKHDENRFAEFDREPLIPHMVSSEGPALAVADINHDGLDDIFIGSSRDRKGAVFLQQTTGKFVQLNQPDIAADSIYENTSACWSDINNDGNVDLILASGGNEFYGQDEHNTPRIYANNGKGQLSKLHNPFGNIFMTASVVVADDVNKDGYNDIFIGGRAVPWAYGEVPNSYLFINNKNGTFTEQTSSLAPGLSDVGFVTNAIWYDIDKDNDNDLLISLEWGGIICFENKNGRFVKNIICDKRGWWNFIFPCDVDGDNKVDIICGNLGLNSRLQANDQFPVRLYYNDFDGNGKKEQVLTYYVGGKEIPFATKAELEKQMPVLKKKFLYAADLAKASLSEIFGSEKLNEAKILTADYFSSVLLMGKGNMQFTLQTLPWQAQLSSLKCAAVVNANNDNLTDILLMGNYYDNNIEMGRYDADFGTLLINKGNKVFETSPLNNIVIKGQVRNMQQIIIKNKTALVLAKNNDSAQIIQFKNFIKK